MGLNIRILVLVICSAGILMVYYGHYTEKHEITLGEIIAIAQEVPHASVGEGPPMRYVISSSQCKMLDPDPWDKSVRKYLVKPRPLSCSYLPLLSYVNQLENLTNTLNIQKKHFKKYKINGNYILKCCYSVISRVEQSSETYNSSADDSIKSTECKYFQDQVSLPNDAEFILIRCMKNQKGKKNEKEIYKTMHSVVPVLPEVRNKLKMINESERTTNRAAELKKLNVILLGIDSVSKLNFRRIMPKTAKYLQLKNWIQLKGYNKIGDNTFPNLMAILSGESMDNLSFWWRNKTQKMDDCPSIWKDFHAANYVSLYAEDTPIISTFNFMRTGFVEKPTDYYMRPFMLAAHENLQQKMLNGLPVCTGPVLVIDHILNYAKMFFKTFSNSSHFSLLWSNSLSHNDLNAPIALDDAVYRFLNDLTKLNIYENSLILFFSDHGVRFGNIRETLIGYIEERQPFMFLWFPKWFREKYPEQYGSLLINQNRLTTPFDIHVTLKNTLQMIRGDSEGKKDLQNEVIPKNTPVSAACPKCTGLFEVQPLERSCRDASIDIIWCLCSRFRNLNVSGEIAKEAGIHVYHYIVNRTEELVKVTKTKKGLCSQWGLTRIYSTHEVIQQDNESRHDIDSIGHGGKLINGKTRIFVVILELSPGHTKFEATVQMRTGGGKQRRLMFLEYPKRLDGIYKTSKCVKNPGLKYYCYCARQ